MDSELADGSTRLSSLLTAFGSLTSPHRYSGMSETMASIGHWSRFESLEQTADGWRQIAQPDPEITGRAGGRLNNLVEMDVKVINPDTLEDQPPGLDTPGEICLRGPQISISYLNNEAATLKSRIPAVASDPDKREWFRSGDFGYLCGPSRLDGFAFLNRMGDTLRLRGFLTNPGEIEDLIKTHPAIREAQVVGCPPTVTVGGVVQEASNTGDVAVAFVILHEQGKNEEAVSRDVIALCKEKLANYKVPQAVFFVTEYPVTQAANGESFELQLLSMIESDASFR